MRSRRLASLLALATLVCPATALAHGGAAAIFDASPFYAGHWFVPVGVAAQVLGSRERAFLDGGLEVSVHHFPATRGRLDSLWGYGGFAQLQVGGVGLDHDGSRAHLRWASGGQVTWSVLGCELAVAHRALVPGHADAIDLAAAGFVSIGVLSAGVHVEAPVVHLGDGPHQLPAIGGMFTAKFPWDLGAPAANAAP